MADPFALVLMRRQNDRGTEVTEFVAGAGAVRDTPPGYQIIGLFGGRGGHRPSGTGQTGRTSGTGQTTNEREFL